MDMDNITLNAFTHRDIDQIIASKAYKCPSDVGHTNAHKLVQDWFCYHYDRLAPLPDLYKWENLGKTLLVSEGNFSFAKSLLLNPRSGIVSMAATTFDGQRSLPPEAQDNIDTLEQFGASVFYKIDAINLTNFFHREDFDTIVFQFPNVGSRDPKHGHNPNHVLLRRFLKSGRNLLKPAGKIIVTTVDNPHYDGAFQYDKAAKFSGFHQPERYRFDPEMFPEYSHTNTHNDDSALSNHQNFITLVFKPDFS